MELIFRFLLDGLLVSLFAVLGHVLKPKSFAGGLICPRNPDTDRLTGALRPPACFGRIVP